MKANRRFGVCDILLPLAALLFLLGLLFVFSPCGAKEDGGWMSCHWAAQALKGVAALALVLALLHLLPAPAERKSGLDLALIATALLALLIPGKLIGLCMMASMRCRSLMAPAVTVFSVLLLALALLDLLYQRKRK